MLRLRGKQKGETTELTVSNRTVVRVLILVILSIIGLAALRRAEHSLILIFTALFLAVALNAPVHWVAERLPGKLRGSRSTATAVSFLLVIVLLMAFFAAIVPPLVRQTDSFLNAAPSLIENSQNQNSAIGRFVQRYRLENEVGKLSQQLRERLQNSTGTAVSTLSAIGSSIFSVLTILVLTFMMLIEGPRWLEFIKRLIPSEYHEHASSLVQDMYHVVKGYVNGQVILATIAALLIFPALVALGISYPIALMVVIFICGLIPMVGHTIGAVIVTGVALFHSVPAALIILAYYIVYQQVETYIIQPRIQATATNMSPLLVFGAVVIGLSFGGLVGGLVAIPIAGCLRVIGLDYLQRQHLLEPVSAIDHHH
ncbi:MAG TPA: AI-2E family transporter [Candidatus Saccharimonadales bacterium]|nr:AI-2E family transporter [Candidatus Saccharimonadales bacterium]